MKPAKEWAKERAFFGAGDVMATRVASAIQADALRWAADEAYLRSSDYRSMGQDAASNVMSNLASCLYSRADAIERGDKQEGGDG